MRSNIKALETVRKIRVFDEALLSYNRFNILVITVKQ